MLQSPPSCSSYQRFSVLELGCVVVVPPSISVQRAQTPPDALRRRRPSGAPPHASLGPHAQHAYDPAVPLSLYLSLCVSVSLFSVSSSLFAGCTYAHATRRHLFSCARAVHIVCFAATRQHGNSIRYTRLR